jgi:hypothetical protein
VASFVCLPSRFALNDCEPPRFPPRRSLPRAKHGGSARQLLFRWRRRENIYSNILDKLHKLAICIASAPNNFRLAIFRVVCYPDTDKLKISLWGRVKLPTGGKVREPFNGMIR